MPVELLFRPCDRQKRSHQKSKPDDVSEGSVAGRPSLTSQASSKTFFCRSPKNLSASSRLRIGVAAAGLVIEISTLSTHVLSLEDALELQRQVHMRANIGQLIGEAREGYGATLDGSGAV